MATLATATEKKAHMGVDEKSERKPQRARVDDKFKIFCGTANEPLADEVCAFLGLTRGQAMITRFRDGEAYVQIQENVRGADVFVIQPTCRRVDEHLVFVEVRDIDWIEANRNLARLHIGQQVHELRETMTVLEARLNPRHFARVHRSAIVNVSRVAAIHPWFNGHHVLVLSTGQQLRMSRYQQEAFLRLTGRRGQ